MIFGSRDSDSTRFPNFIRVTSGYNGALAPLRRWFRKRFNSESVGHLHFGDIVTTVFKPLADRAGLDFQAPRPDIYQIAGTHFVLRLRRGTGHYKDVLITLAPADAPKRDLADLTGEIGLNAIAEYHGLSTREQDLSSAESFHATLQQVGELTEKICVPYLLGQKSDYKQIRAFVDRKIEEAGKHEFNFPSNVREEWIP